MQIDKLFWSYFDSFTNWILRNEGFSAFRIKEANFSFFFPDVWLFLVVFDLSLSHMSKWTATFIKSARLTLIKLGLFKVVFFLLGGGRSWEWGVNLTSPLYFKKYKSNVIIKQVFTSSLKTTVFEGFLGLNNIAENESD